MSLTSFLKQSKDIRTALRQTFPLPRHQGPFPALRAQPLTTNYALVGQAFDYLLRFYIQRHNPNSKGWGWVADIIRAVIEVKEGDEKGLLRQEAEYKAQTFLEQAHKHHKTYLSTGEITDDLLRSCLDLAIMDGLVRAGEIRGNLGEADPRDLRDLRNLFALIPQTPFLDGTPCLLNPIFPFPSGADCDLLIGTTLIEIKTTKISELKQDYYQQLLGYSFINLANEKHYREIEQIGVYFSRHGYLWTIPIEEIGGKQAFQRFLPIWNDHVERYHQPRKPKEEVDSTQRLQELIDHADKLSSTSSYMHWLASLSSNDFQIWKDYPTAPYYVQGALKLEEERRQTQKKLRPANNSEVAAD